MLFQSKYDRARKLQRERMGDAPRALEDENLADKLEKHDTFALIVSALITILPAALLFLAVVVGIAYFFVIR